MVREDTKQVRVSAERCDSGFSDAEASIRFTKLFGDTYRDVLAYALRRTDNRFDAEDVVAGTFLVAWGRLDDVLAAEAPLAWLYGVAYRTLANQRRTQRRASALRERLESDPPSPFRDRAPDAAVAKSQLSEILQALGTLKERDQEALRLAAFEELSPTEIGQALGVSPGQARTYLHRARRRLQRALDTLRSQSTGGAE